MWPPPEPPTRSLGKYGLMRRRYLKEERPVLWGTMTMAGILYQYLLKVEDRANEMLEQMMPSSAKTAGATEQLKSSDPMKWAAPKREKCAQSEC